VHHAEHGSIPQREILPNFQLLEEIFVWTTGGSFAETVPAKQQHFESKQVYYEAPGELGIGSPTEFSHAVRLNA
jgi:hypothetical protein